MPQGLRREPTLRRGPTLHRCTARRGRAGLPSELARFCRKPLPREEISWKRGEHPALRCWGEPVPTFGSRRRSSQRRDNRVWSKETPPSGGTPATGNAFGRCWSARPLRESSKTADPSGSTMAPAPSGLSRSLAQPQATEAKRVDRLRAERPNTSLWERRRRVVVRSLSTSVERAPSGVVAAFGRRPGTYTVDRATASAGTQPA
jgi:hypothetical protein